MASKLVHVLAKNNGALDDGDRVKLANLIKVQFQGKWEKLWQAYELESWLNNINLSETERIDDVTSESKNTTDITHDDTHYDVDITNSRTGSDTTNTTRTGNVASAESGTSTDNVSHVGKVETKTEHSGDITDKIDTKGTDYAFGFNSTGEDGNLNGRVIGDDSNKRTFNNTDTTTVTPTGSADNRSISHGKTVTDTFNNVKDESKTEYNSSMNELGNRDTAYDRDKTVDITKSGSLGRDRTNTLTGYDYRRGNLLENITVLFENPNAFPFFEIVFEDIDKVLTVPLFK